MKLENQVTSLELSQKLKELGVKQESLFYWQKIDLKQWEIEAGVQPFSVDYLGDDKIDTSYSTCSAFTVAELLDLCPASTSMLKRTDLPTKSIPRYYVETFEHYRDSDYDGNPANALAKMLIYLLENDLLNK